MCTYIWLVWHRKLAVVYVYSKDRRYNHIKCKSACVCRKSTYVTTSLDLLKWCKSTCFLTPLTPFVTVSSLPLPGKEKDFCSGWSGARAPLPGRTAQLPSWMMPDRLGGSWDLAAFSSEGLLFWISSSGLVLQICKTLIISEISRPQPAFEPAGSFNQIYEQGPDGYVCIKLVSLGEQTGKPSNLVCSWSYRGLMLLSKAEMKQFS